MNQEILRRLLKVELRTKENITEEVKIYISQLPDDYVDFITAYNGGVGFIGESDSYLDLWTLDNILQLNPYFPEEDFSKEVVIIGSDGSGTLYGYDLLNKSFFETDEFQMSRKEAIKCGNSFLDMIKYLEIKQY